MITLYDFDTNLPGRGLSPFVWRVRFALQIKGIPYKTEWLDFVNLAEQLKERNVPPSKIQPDGSGFYSVPAIYDPSTDTAISDSPRILLYLDEAYPDTPQLCTYPGTLPDDLKSAFEPDWLLPTTLTRKGTWGLYAPTIAKNVSNEAVTAKMQGKLAAMSGLPFDALLGEDKQREFWEQAREGFREVDAALEEIRKAYGSGGPWLLGKEVKYPDIAIAAPLAWVVSALGEDSGLWKEIREWDGGRWAKIWDQMKPYHELH